MHKTPLRNILGEFFLLTSTAMPIIISYLPILLTIALLNSQPNHHKRQPIASMIEPQPPASVLSCNRMPRPMSCRGFGPPRYHSMRAFFKTAYGVLCMSTAQYCPSWMTCSANGWWSISPSSRLAGALYMLDPSYKCRERCFRPKQGSPRGLT